MPSPQDTLRLDSLLLRICRVMVLALLVISALAYPWQIDTERLINWATNAFPKSVARAFLTVFEPYLTFSCSPLILKEAVFGIGVATLAVFFTAWLAFPSRGRSPLSREESRRFLALAGLLALGAISAIFLSPSYYFSLCTLACVISGALYFWFTASLARHAADNGCATPLLKQGVVVILALSFILCVVALMMHFGLSAGFLLQYPDPRNRVGSFIGHNTGLSSYLMMALLLTIAQMFGRGGRGAKSLLGGLAALQCLVILIAQSRAVWLILIVLAPLLAVRLRRLTGFGPRLRHWVILGATALLLVLSQVIDSPVNVFGVRDYPLLKRLQDFRPDQLRRETRTRIVFATLSDLAKHPGRALIGYGLGSFQYEYPRAQMEYYEAHPLMWIDPTDKRTPQAHNDYLQLIFETGLIGFLLTGAFVAVEARRGWRRQAQALAADPRGEVARVGMAWALAAVCLHALVDFPAHIEPLIATALFLFATWSATPSRDCGLRIADCGLKTPEDEDSQQPANVPNQKSQISNLKSEIPTPRMAGLKSEISNLKSQVTDSTPKIAGLKSEISNLKSEMSQIPSPQSENPQSAIRNPQSNNPQSAIGKSAIHNPQSENPQFFASGVAAIVLVVAAAAVAVVFFARQTVADYYRLQADAAYRWVVDHYASLPDEDRMKALASSDWAYRVAERIEPLEGQSHCDRAQTLSAEGEILMRRWYDAQHKPETQKEAEPARLQAVSAFQSAVDHSREAMGDPSNGTGGFRNHVSYMTLGGDQRRLFMLTRDPAWLRAAIEDLETATRYSPPYADPALELIALYTQQKIEPQRTLELKRDLARYAPDAYQEHFKLRAYDLRYNGHYQEAVPLSRALVGVAAYEKVESDARLAPEAASVTRHYIETLIDAGMINEAKSELKDAEARFNNPWLWAKSRAHLAVVEGRWDEALTLARGIRAHNPEPGDNDSWETLEAVALRQTKSPDADQKLAEIRAQSKKNPMYLMYLGLFEADWVGDRAAAIAALTERANMKPEPDAYAYGRLALLLADAKRADEARHYAQIALAKNPSYTRMEELLAQLKQP